MTIDNTGKTKRNKKKEHDLRIIEVVAKVKVAEAQTKKLEAEARSAEIMAKVALLRERRKLLDENFSIEDVDELLPMPKKA